MRKMFLFLVVLWATGSVFGQGGVSFQKVKEFYINGDTRVIGNSILSDHPTRVNNKPKSLNDRTEMQYVDIDGNSDTFSSSSANLDLPADAKIVYAGLYWAATYPGAEGKQKVRNSRMVYDIKKKRNRPFDLVKLKIPGNEDYISVQGELVYDGVLDPNTDLKNAAPYVCYSDVTDLLNSPSAGSGTYTLANVTALEGIMFGGSSAGWMLYLVYEQQQAPLQYMTSYQGFRYISINEPEELRFSGFRVPETGEVKASLTLAALEGDLLLAKDAVFIYGEESEEYVPLKSKVRYANNFFNSSITFDDKKFLARNPASNNTLGFDLAKLQIPNENNSLIDNDATGVTLRFKTEEDRLFVFFTAFQTEISSDYYQRVVVEGKKDRLPVQEEVEPTPKKTEVVVYEKDGSSEDEVITDSKPEKVINRDPVLNEMLSTSSIKVAGQPEGYYVVNHVFSNATNASRWARKMEGLGFAPKNFVNPENGYHYIYIDFSQDPDALYNRLQGYRKIEDLEKAWILKVNLD
ncbi:MULTISPECIES: hypothetical protein [unclassified Leeuwenhoekiella]|uniref:hypothetical protein n=1 Tax=unclassified Leeuwenhoekiella TaxID=2615029 RepID=UPI000C5CE210|nr:MULTISPECIES: hypothetical protein [unclassified Leeuwenhoekiella]MBA79931.1 hypothetical protein [Leeuwenhoekiella sp.]|tara:strand:+ start:13377 stop:14936 length:1560 start_codon:yes stop_codon:yes gene_type:complete